MIRNIWCLGRSYADHAKELGNEVPKSPLVFLKAGSCALPPGSSIKLPNEKDEIHHEVEMALLLDNQLNVSHYTVAIDLTNRTEQSRLKEKGHAWTLAKSFKGACPLGEWQELKDEDLNNLSLSLKVNQKIRQEANTSLLLIKVDKIVDYIKANFPVCPGDVILTGTPKGVSAIASGDKLEAQIGSYKASWIVD
jgi:2-keto-4-pentenoate hydratase/2-oxohepta-3-ene-1,7-dioic acid hydratase in catechol pathway